VRGVLAPALTLKPQSNGMLYSDMVIGSLAADVWAVTLGTAMRRRGGLQLYTPPPWGRGQ